MLHHVMITRFSVNTALAGRMRRKDADEDYLRYRLRLFELFCLPSVRAQTNKKFTWFVLFGGETPEWMCARLSEWEHAGDFIPLYSHSFGEALDSVRDWVAINTHAGDHLMTTRFDNDDALGCRMVEHLHNSADMSKDVQYFCPVRGQQVVVKDDNPKKWRFFKFGYPANPFVSMMESLDGQNRPLMIYHKKHGSIQQKALGMPVTRLPYAPAWMQILHGKNLGNGLWTRHRAGPNLSEFPFLEAYYKEGIPENLRSDR
jgi:hypothetical protein